MRRSTTLGVVATALLSIAMSLIAASFFLHPVPATSHSAATTLVVAQFYAAANEAIATGTTAPLRQVIAPHFVDRAPLPGVGPGREGLEAYLIALHTANPSLRLVAEPLLTTEDHAVALVTLQADRPDAALQRAIVDRSAPWGAVDLFRVAGGQIVERWTNTGGFSLVQPLADLSLELPAPAHRMMAFERWRIAPGAVWRSRAAGLQILYLQQGALRAEITPPAAALAPTSPATTLSAGQSLVIDPGSETGVTNVGAGPAQLLIARFDVPAIPAGEPPAAETLPTGVTGQFLAGELATEVGIGSAAVELARVTLASDGRLSISSADGPVLIAIEAGQPRVTAWGRVWARRGSDGMSRTIDKAALNAGDGLLAHPESHVTLQGDGESPVIALVLTLRSGADQGS